MKKLCITSLIVLSFLSSGYKMTESYVIDSEQNAYIHNNKGLIYLKEKSYYPAIQEFKIAISLSPNTQASSVFYNNLGECYMELGHPEMAQDCFERALQQFTLNFKYYQNLAKCYYDLGYAEEQIQHSYNDKNPLGMVLRGLLYEMSGDKVRAITTLDEFTSIEPDLTITEAVKQHIKELVKQTYEDE
ncbi:MAG: tetratricopeptide repeat protein [Candidatus Gastranaerophilaceae bacterium]|nr:tetratricopeptide repeat protein [Candidatus Gastranaerophilaceae bacterium]